MGVMICNRKGCDNIMSRTHIPVVGYICTNCKEEFEDYLYSKNKEVLKNSEMITELIKFMSTIKDCEENDDDEEINVVDFLNNNTYDFYSDIKSVCDLCYNGTPKQTGNMFICPKCNESVN